MAGAIGADMVRLSSRPTGGLSISEGRDAVLSSAPSDFGEAGGEAVGDEVDAGDSVAGCVVAGDDVVDLLVCGL